MIFIVVMFVLISCSCALFSGLLSSSFGSIKVQKFARLLVPLALTLAVVLFFLTGCTEGAVPLTSGCFALQYILCVYFNP